MTPAAEKLAEKYLADWYPKGILRPNFTPADAEIALAATLRIATAPLVEALEKFGKHGYGCDKTLAQSELSYEMLACTCGLDKARRAAREWRE